MHSLEEAQQIARNILARQIGINKNADLALSEDILGKL